MFVCRDGGVSLVSHVLCYVHLKPLTRAVSHESRVLTPPGINRTVFSV